MQAQHDSKRLFVVAKWVFKVSAVKPRAPPGTQAAAAVCPAPRCKAETHYKSRIRKIP